MRNFALIALFIVLVGFVLFACTNKTFPATKLAPVTAEATPTPGASAKKMWQEQWEQLIKAAQKEGTIVVLISAGGEVRARLSQAFQDKYGIRTEITVSTTTEHVNRVFSTRRAGLYLTDVIITGSTSSLTVLKPAGVFTPMETAIILPEVLDPEVWWSGGIRWLDKDHMVVGAVATVIPSIFVNRNLVTSDEIKSFRDLLNPKWKEKIVLQDPTMPGFAQRVLSVAGLTMGWDFIRSLANQNPVITRDLRLMTEWVAQGKYPIHIGGQFPTVMEYRKAGAPLGIVISEEGEYVASSNSAIALFDRPAHPNAARLFVNWFLSREGQTVNSQAEGFPSARRDVTTQSLVPETIPKPGKKYYIADTEEASNQLLEANKLLIEIFKPLQK